MLDKVQKWLSVPQPQRDYEAGALMMLQITMNRIQYANVMRNLTAKSGVVDYELEKYAKAKAKAVEHAQVTEMRGKVSEIAHKRNLDGSKWTTSKNRGKRVDHDSLPDDIKALYTENLSLLQAMREDHVQLRRLVNDEKVTCLDAEQYPFLKDIIEKDEQMHKNWQAYDNFGASPEDAEQQLAEDEKKRSLNAFRMLIMCKGQYKKKPTEKKKQQIQELLTQIINPSEDLIKELKAMGIIE
jgi:hypothetical protein